MTNPAATPRLACIQLHPIKSLNPVCVSEAIIGPNGGLEHDRVWALYAADGDWINGKRTPAVHFLHAEYAADFSSVTLTAPLDTRNLAPTTLAFPEDIAGAAAWFSAYFEQPVMVHYAREGFPDDGLASGPTLASSASLDAVCEWFPRITHKEARLRFRTTLEIDGVPAFWEDRLFAADERGTVRFRIGGIAFEGSNPCARCPVPPRDSRTAEVTPLFQKRFSEFRKAQLPPWSPAARFDHYYRFAVNTRVPGTETGKPLRLGDPLTLA